MSFFPWNKSNKKNKEKNKEKSGDVGKFFILDITQARGMANFPNLMYYVTVEFREVSIHIHVMLIFCQI